MKIKIRKIPGPKSAKILDKAKILNAGWSGAHPFVHSGEGRGCFFKDIDGNVLLDFASQIASLPLGYNDSDLNRVVDSYKKHPVKYAGQDFYVKEHVQLLEELLKIAPADAGFLCNSGAEAVENCLKLAMRSRPRGRYGLSFKSAFHGRTLGALSCTDSEAVQKKGFFSMPVKRLPYGEEALDEMERILDEESSADEIAFVIVECIQGEGGYNVAPKLMIKRLRKFTKQHGIPLITDEVQSGLGRTGKWWAYDHFGIKPDIISSAKALQVGAALCKRRFIPEEGSISSTWGGGHVIDMAVGLETLRIIRKRNLLNNAAMMGVYMTKRLKEIDENGLASNPRGLGLMLAFDCSSEKERDLAVIECMKRGLVVLGCGTESIRLAPPLVVGREEMDAAADVITESLTVVKKNTYISKGKICNYMS